MERQKRHKVAEAMSASVVQKATAGGMLLPPKHGGKTVTMANGSYEDDNGYNGNGNSTATVHEGPDAEQLLHQTYELQDVLGVGSTSTVQQCRHRKTGAIYACKVIDVLQIEERFQGMMVQFQTEIEALRQLQHPGIIGLYDVFLSPNKIYIIMECMQGGELFDYVVQKGTLTEEEASQIVRKVTSALVYMHDKNIVHRDLKPENLLLKRKPSSSEKSIDVKIIDFGLSKVSFWDNMDVLSHNCCHVVPVTSWIPSLRCELYCDNRYQLVLTHVAALLAITRPWKNPSLAPFWEREGTWHPKCYSAEITQGRWIRGRSGSLSLFYYVDVCLLMMILPRYRRMTLYAPNLYFVFRVGPGISVLLPRIC